MHVYVYMCSADRRPYLAAAACSQVCSCVMPDRTGLRRVVRAIADLLTELCELGFVSALAVLAYPDSGGDVIRASGCGADHAADLASCTIAFDASSTNKGAAQVQHALHASGQYGAGLPPQHQPLYSCGALTQITFHSCNSVTAPHVPTQVCHTSSTRDTLPAPAAAGGPGRGDSQQPTAPWPTAHSHIHAYCSCYQQIGCLFYSTAQSSA